MESISSHHQSLEGATEPAVAATEEVSNIDAVHIIDLTLKTANMLNQTSITFATTVEINYHTTLDALHVEKGAIHVGILVISPPSVVHQGTNIDMTYAANTVTTDFVQSLSNEHDYVFAATSVSKDTPKSEHVYITQCSSSCIPKCQVKVQGQSVEMIVDSGASVNILESATFQRLRDKPPLQSSPTRVYPYGSDTPLPVIGIANLDLQYNGAYLSTQFHIVEGNNGNLLGFKAAEELKILMLTRHITADRKKDAENATDAGSILEDYQYIFSGIGKFRNRMESLHIDESVTPKQQPRHIDAFLSKSAKTWNKN